MTSFPAFAICFLKHPTHPCNLIRLVIVAVVSLVRHWVTRTCSYCKYLNQGLAFGEAHVGHRLNDNRIMNAFKIQCCYCLLDFFWEFPSINFSLFLVNFHIHYTFCSFSLFCHTRDAGDAVFAICLWHRIKFCA